MKHFITPGFAIGTPYVMLFDMKVLTITKRISFINQYQKSAMSDFIFIKKPNP